MVRYANLENGEIKLGKGLEFDPKTVIWVDMLDASDAEIQYVETTLEVKIFTQKEREEIESSSKYIEIETEVGINLNFLYSDNDGFRLEPVSFLHKANYLITNRQQEFPSFDYAYNRIQNVPTHDGIDVFLTIVEFRIDFDADLIEGITDTISQISKNLSTSRKVDRDILLKITSLQDDTMKVRENIVEKQRIISAMLKSKYFSVDDYETLHVMLKDVDSLLDHTSFNFERLEFLQDTFMGLVNMEQNGIVKIFSVVSVIFMPPTLIAGIYGMNFDFIPMLHKSGGFGLSVILMVLSSVLTLLYFRLKKWL